MKVFKVKDSKTGLYRTSGSVGHSKRGSSWPDLVNFKAHLRVRPLREGEEIEVFRCVDSITNMHKYETHEEVCAYLDRRCDDRD